MDLPGALRTIAMMLILGGAITVAGDEYVSSHPISFDILSVEANGKAFIPQGRSSINLGPFPTNIFFRFAPATNATRPPVRVRGKLEGIDNAWQEGGGEMLFVVRFYNEACDRLSQKAFSVRGESTGWAGGFENPALNHRTETVIVPPEATRLWVVISSAGPPATMGVYIVHGLVVSRPGSGGEKPEILLRSPFDQQPVEGVSPPSPIGWERDGTRPSMARVIQLGPHSNTPAFMLVDDDPSGHAEWRNSKEMAPRVVPNERLIVEWNEMYSIGVNDYRATYYDQLPPGDYRFHVAEATVFGKPTGAEATILVRVPLPYWKRPWVWAVLASLTVASVGGGTRYFAWRKMRREVLRLQQQRALEQERLRIAQDIHDDLGARATEISLVSAMAQKNSTFPSEALSEFDRISQLSRELVAALYETIWTVNPEKDNLEATGTYLCQRVNRQCAQAQLPCRVYLSTLPQDVVLSSRDRHNLSMASTEALHNVIKHARASQVIMRVDYVNSLLTICLEDDGSGFHLFERQAGSGLTNMNRRLEEIGGKCVIMSDPKRGTKVRFELLIKPMEGCLSNAH
jgi:signal transduction histidine kinase